MLELTINDIGDGKITLPNRVIDVPNSICELCLSSAKEKVYQKKDGSSIARSEITYLIPNERIIKLSDTNTKTGKANKYVVHRRLDTISEKINEPHFNPKQIWYSGMLSVAKKYYIENGKLDDLLYDKIKSQFNIANIYAIKRDFLNIGTIKELYNL